MERFDTAFSKNREQNRALLEGYRERAQEEHIDRNLTRMMRASEGDLVARRRNMRMLRAYAAHLFANMAAGMQACDSAFLLLDPEGCAVQMRTSGDFGSLLQDKGIVLGSVWRPDVTGADAASVGNAERCAMQSAGEDHYLPLLQDLAIYYAPLQVMEKGILLNMGGIAWICPLQSRTDAFMMSALAIASAINIRVSTSWNTCDSYEGDTAGVVQLDINTINGAVSMTHHNRKLFEVLEIQPLERWDCYFKPVNELIDPLPDNARLWEIIDNQKEVRDREITIQVEGRKLSRVITTVSTTHPELKSKGLLLSITTRKDISHQVADKTGNNAVISFQDVVGNSSIMKNRIKRARLLAGTDSNIMILGESGVGKDVFAQAIHNQSHRRGGPFVSVNCGAIPRDLIASELFGYDAGAFTGAKKQGNIGKFELAEGGTLFLDEIGEMPLDLQATLLRAVEQKQFMRLGSSRVIKADVRIISATNVDINRMIREKRFRSDLYYRLSTMSMDLPPLRDRGEDVILLAESFIRKISRKIGRQDIMELTPEAKDFLRQCPWQGNVRELQNLIDCLVQLYPDHLITLDLVRENINPAYFAAWQPAYTAGYGPAGGSMADRNMTAGNLAGGNPVRGYESGTGRHFSEMPAPGAPAFPGTGREYGNGYTSPAAAGPYPARYSGTEESAQAAAHTYPARHPGQTDPFTPAPSPRRYPETAEPVPGDPYSARPRRVLEEAEGESRRDMPLLTKEEILEALQICEGNRSKAAKYLSVGRRTLYRYIDRFGIGDKFGKKS